MTIVAAIPTLSWGENLGRLALAAALGGAIGFERELRDREAGFRSVPGSIVRRGAFIAKGAVLMPSFVNIGGYVGENSMIDAWATVGSCAQIGANVHISGGAGIGGVLEPVGAAPVVIEDDVFVGGNCGVYEGTVVRAGAGAPPGHFRRLPALRSAVAASTTRAAMPVSPALPHTRGS